ncbi:MAG: TIGR02117 family protein [Pseudomonadota bacterium]|jgi:uncharacterized protein (TIGR02117 family)
MPPKIYPLRNGARLLGAAVAALVAILLAYGAAGMVGGAIPSNPGWTQPESGVRIYIESNGIHTGIVVPMVGGGEDWRDLLRAADLRDPRYAGYSHVSIGWGERTFYLETPTWADVKPLTILGAAMGSDRTVMHVDHVPEPRIDADDAGDIRSVMLRPEEYRRLAAFIRASFRTDNGQRPGHQFGYAGYDAFYEARGRYSAVRTCNAWTGDALRHAGVRVGAWTPFPVTVLGWFE